MKKIFTMFLAFSMAVALSACSGGNQKPESGKAEEKKADGKFVVALEAGFAPYEYIGDNGEVVGIDIDIAKAVADKMGKELEVKDMDFDGALLAVQSGKVDCAASGISVTDDRKEKMDFSDYYVDSTEVVVVNAKDPAVESPTWEALNDKTIAVQQGNIADIQVSDEANTKAKEIKRYSKFLQAAEDLKNNKVDCIVMDQMPAEELVAQSNGALKIVEGDPLFVDQYAIAVQKGNTELLDTINAVLKELKDSGELDKIIKAHTEK